MRVQEGRWIGETTHVGCEGRKGEILCHCICERGWESKYGKQVRFSAPH